MSEIDSSVVENYLKQHPEFFNEHLELLEHMTVPHPSGNAVSLISKQLELFRQRHHDMEVQLNGLIEIARDNDHSANQMHELTLAVIEVDTLDAAIENLNVVLAECFLTDFFSVKIISADKHKSALADLFVAPDCEELTHFVKELGSNQASCGKPTLAQAQFLFGDNALEVQSCAIIPMSFTEIEGLLAIGSRDDSRFHYSMGHLFLTQMSEIIGTRFASLLKAA
ncbi:DUF484 family protein [methanotrophic endosymbiont of Bathymodiolus puteoserpentis (Logatchev)]|jgi:uncharacterized protein YigA (DUF484 family)|uniref:DUF484 family protein n=1 Tax=methanotrophic endosymbiont of Bathymodiolus puteoserpentis (Logatchev) TaxID=343235 RepID=UPI0013C7E0BC|nr:DUF484 family protein [methanotrophic endosymbiont of Bathymodiolus puteoserpentis (Logatchev)]SHE19068.1 Protein of unknown function DUF484 [methanotrophic endosymbiont of Bathymodiolus puteoserpentis (Logatchev)]